MCPYPAAAHLLMQGIPHSSGEWLLSHGTSSATLCSVLQGTPLSTTAAMNYFLRTRPSSTLTGTSSNHACRGGAPGQYRYFAALSAVQKLANRCLSSFTLQDVAEAPRVVITSHYTHKTPPCFNRPAKGQPFTQSLQHTTSVSLCHPSFHTFANREHTSGDLHYHRAHQCRTTTPAA